MTPVTVSVGIVGFLLLFAFTFYLWKKRNPRGVPAPSLGGRLRRTSLRPATTDELVSILLPPTLKSYNSRPSKSAPKSRTRGTSSSLAFASPTHAAREFGAQAPDAKSTVQGVPYDSYSYPHLTRTGPFPTPPRRGSTGSYAEAVSEALSSGTTGGNVAGERGYRGAGEVYEQ